MEPEKNYRLTDRFLKNEEFSSERNVVKAYDSATDSYVAIKRWQNDDFRGINEIAQKSSLSMEGIAPFVCSFEEERYRYMVSKWAEGVNLNDYISENGTFEEKDALMIFYRICKVLVGLGEHPGGALIFNDLKPENIIIEKTRETGAEKYNVKIIDFETCVRADESGSCLKDRFPTLPAGSYFFSAPEALMYRSTVFSDVYSAGAVLGYMLFGREFYEKTDECIKLGRFGSLAIVRECMVRNEAYRRIPARRILEKTLKYLETGEYVPEEIPEEMPGKAAECDKEEKDNEKNGTVLPFAEKEEKKQTDDINILGKNFRVASKLSLCTDDNLCFATELAFSCAETFGMKTLLVDSFTIRNRISSYMLADMVREADSCTYGRFGLEACMNGDTDDWYEHGLIGKMRDHEYLCIGTEILQDEIFTDMMKLRDFYAWAYRHFDAVIVNMYKNTDEKIRDEILRIFDCVVVAASPNIDDMESACEHYTELSKKGKVYRENVKYVAWDYMKDRSLPEKGISCLTGEDVYLGAISYDTERYRKRNTKQKPEFYGANSSVKKEYRGILTKMLFGGEK